MALFLIEKKEDLDKKFNPTRLFVTKTKSTYYAAAHLFF